MGQGFKNFPYLLVRQQPFVDQSYIIIYIKIISLNQNIKKYT